MAREPFLLMQLWMRREDHARGLEAIGGFDLRARLDEIRVPTLVTAGAEDEATTVDDARFIQERIPDARLVVLEGAAHLANVEQTSAFTGEVLDHLRT